MIICNDKIGASIDLEPEVHLSELVNKITGHTFKFHESPPCALRLATEAERIDIPGWKLRPGSSDMVAPEDERGYRAGFHKPDVDVTDWIDARLLNEFPIRGAYSTIVYPGYGWYRCTFDLFAHAKGKSVEFVLGGCDNQDWLDYRVYLNGTLIGHASPEDPWHPAPKYVLHPGSPEYDAIAFGSSNVLAVQARGLDRSVQGTSMPNAEQYGGQAKSLLADQYISIGPAYREVSDFQLLDHVQAPDKTAVEFRMRNMVEGLDLSIRYWIDRDEAALYKQITVENTGNIDHTLLEIDLERLTGDFTADGGGMGFPCTVGDELFCGISHPAGVCQGGANSVCLTTFPGKRIAPGGSYQSKVAVFGAGPSGQAGQSFVDYIESHGHRKRELLTMYHCYGIHDLTESALDKYREQHTEYADQAAKDTIPAEKKGLTEEIVMSNLDDLERFRKHGICFDYYFIDAGWSNPNGDLKDFDPQNFPEGGGKVMGRVQDLGMKLGLWTSPGAGPMAFNYVENPDLEPCKQFPGPDGALCMTAEPWHTMYKDALLYHVKENGVRGFKFDGNFFMCNNKAHGHLPGKYSVESTIDALISIVEEVRRECPDVFIMYYWGITSPWWLLHGNTIYERGVLMEGATPSHHPARLSRQSISISFDEATHHAWDKVPLCSGDSLGVWISEKPWGSYIGKEGWQDAWVMEIARGSMLSQIWGDLSMFDADDVDFLARISAWLRDYSRLLRHPKRILGDPWKAEPYGYAYFDGDDGVIFIYNPTFEHTSVALRLGDEIGFSGEGAYALRSVYPGRESSHLPGKRVISAGDEFSVPLKPFEVAMLQLCPADLGLVAPFPAVVREEEESLSIPSSFKELSREVLSWENPDHELAIRQAVNGRRPNWDDRELTLELAQTLADDRDIHIVRRLLVAEVGIPPVIGKATLLVSCKLSRDGVYWQHVKLHQIVGVKAVIEGESLPVSSTPDFIHQQAGGWSWILFEIPLAQCDDSRVVSLQIEASLPETVDIDSQTWLFRP